MKRAIAYIKATYETFLLMVMIWAAGRIGYQVALFTPQDGEGSGEIRVIHFYDTEWNLRKSMVSYLEEA